MFETLEFLTIAAIVVTVGIMLDRLHPPGRPARWDGGDQAHKRTGWAHIDYPERDN